MGDEAMTGRDQREARLRQAADNGDAHAQEMLLASQSTRYIRTPGSHVLAAAGINVQTLADAAGRGDELRALNRVLRGIA